MKEKIIQSLDDPQELEKLYRDNKSGFKKAFDLIYLENKQKLSVQFWHERLANDSTGLNLGTSNELLFVLMISLTAGLIAKIPHFTGFDEETFYSRNIAFIIFPMLSVYFVWKQKLQIKTIALIAGIFIISAVYINFLPLNENSDTLILACIHLPLLLWAVTGFVFTGNHYKSFQKRIDFLRYNGDLVVMTAVTLIAGGILSAVTVGLFKLIEIPIEEFYFKYVAIWGLAAAPIAATYLVRSNPQLVQNVSPVIAKVFTPLVLIMITAYLIAIIYTSKDPYNDREFLMVFNILLIGVMAIILFSVAESSDRKSNKTGILLLLALSVVTIIVNGIALSAIIFRITEWGITPNRIAVFGANILILMNLLLVTFKLFKSLRNSDELQSVENSIAIFLPVYTGWTIIVVFLFPLLFNFQ